MESIDLLSLYQMMNENHLVNRKDSQYWFYDIQTRIIKQQDGINKRFVKICFFNRMMNEHNSLMRLYLNLNGEKFVQERFEVEKKYNNPNIMFFILERDLAEEEYNIEIESYIIDGKKINTTKEYINDIEINNDIKKRNLIIEKYFKKQQNLCLTFPTYTPDYWICTCGYYNDGQEEICPRCKMKKELIKRMIHIQSDDLLQGITNRIELNVHEPINQIVKKNIDYYDNTFGIDEEKVINAIDVDLLKEKQNKMIDQYINQYITQNKIDFNLKLSFQENVVLYCQKIANDVIQPNDVFKKLDIEEYQSQYDSLKNNKSEKNKQMKKFVIIGGVAVALLFAGIGMYFLMNGHSDDSPSTIQSSNNDNEGTKDNEFKLNETEYTIDIGKEEKIQFENWSNDIMIISKDPNIVTVSNDGIMEGISNGKTQIEVYDKTNSKNYIIHVEVIGEIKNSNYILPNSDTQVITEDDLKDLTKEQLQLARNEIYARHGCLFETTSIQDYFDQFLWYQNVKTDIYAKDYHDLSQLEYDNAVFIREYEKKID